MKINEQELIKYYKNHSMKSCVDKFNLSKYKINKILLAHEVTFLARYGSISPFGNADVQAKAKNTFIEKYGVDNPFKNKEIQDRIQVNQKNKYGGIGWSSDEIRTKYNETMQERYGVEWGCMKEQCKEANRGSNSEANLACLQRLNEKNLQYSTEYVLDNFRYDFKVGNRLIEINPTATHNSS